MTINLGFKYGVRLDRLWFKKKEQSKIHIIKKGVKRKQNGMMEDWEKRGQLLLGNYGKKIVVD